MKNYYIMLGMVMLTCATACQKSSNHASLQPDATDGMVNENMVGVKAVFENGFFLPGWSDWGWAERTVQKGVPARLNLSNKQGWQIGSDVAAPAFKTLRFQIFSSMPATEFLDVSLQNHGKEITTFVTVQGRHVKSTASGWQTIEIPGEELNPNGVSFQRIRFQPRIRISSDWIMVKTIEIDWPEAMSADSGAKSAEKDNFLPASVSCETKTHQIDPKVFGMASDVDKSWKDELYLKQSGFGGRRWGGNATSRYNWRIGNIWNTAEDWYFRNVVFTDQPGFSWKTFLSENQKFGFQTALTLPFVGYVAKDSTSYSFPVSQYGPQQEVEPGRPDVGNGIDRNGKHIRVKDPLSTSVRFGATDAAEWVRAIKAWEKATGADRAVDMYFLGNEPMLWNSTHRDVHPDATTYDELLKKTIAYITAIRGVDPRAVIAGPSVWGWPAYFYSARDQEVGFGVAPDRLAHGNTPFLEWYLSELRSYEKRSGVRMLDMLDVHFYPQADNLFPGNKNETEEISDLRVRATRGLWDKTYTDESWINESIYLLPRLKQIIDKSYPGVKISIGEYSFGGEFSPSSAVAVAEALGRFTAFDGIAAAFYWGWPNPTRNSHVLQAFKAYRNFDNKGGAFETWSVPTKSPEDISLYASRNTDGSRVVTVAVNLSRTQKKSVAIDFGKSAPSGTANFYQYQPKSIKVSRMADSAAQFKNGTARVQLPPYSITVIELLR